MPYSLVHMHSAPPELILPHTFFISISESAVSVTDTLVAGIALKRSISEGLLGISDAIGLTGLYQRLIGESNITTSDAVSVLHGTFNAISINEVGIVISATVSRILKSKRTITEPAKTVVDGGITRRIINKKTITESGLAITDSISRVVSFFRKISEAAIPITDTVDKAIILVRKGIAYFTKRTATAYEEGA
jgi:hypothetical protein